MSSSLALNDDGRGAVDAWLKTVSAAPVDPGAVQGWYWRAEQVAELSASGCAELIMEPAQTRDGRPARLVLGAGCFAPAMGANTVANAAAKAVEILEEEDAFERAVEDIKALPVQEQAAWPAKLVRVFLVLHRQLGGDVAAMRRWWASANAGVGGVPAEIVGLPGGIPRVLGYLEGPPAAGA